MVLIYPVITMGEFTHGGSKAKSSGRKPASGPVRLYSNELQVTKDTPPTFLIHAITTRPFRSKTALCSPSALRKAGVPFELHLYEQGPHGFGLAPANPILATWTKGAPTGSAFTVLQRNYETHKQKLCRRRLCGTARPIDYPCGLHAAANGEAGEKVQRPDDHRG